MGHRTRAVRGWGDFHKFMGDDMTTDNAILEILHAIRTDLAAVKADVESVKADVASVKSDQATQRVDTDAARLELVENGVMLVGLRSDVEAITDAIGNWPDLHFLHAAALQQFRDAGEAREQRRYMEIRLDEVYNAMVTGPEITGLRSDVSTSIDRERELDLRISTVESHLGIGNPLGSGHPLAPE
jgi:hypothetical protein